MSIVRAIKQSQGPWAAPPTDLLYEEVVQLCTAAVHACRLGAGPDVLKYRHQVSGLEAGRATATGQQGRSRLRKAMYGGMSRRAVCGYDHSNPGL
jgi:hypothetical protein